MIIILENNLFLFKLSVFVIKLRYTTIYTTIYNVIYYTDYLLVGLRYGFYPHVTDVISQTSEVRASEYIIARNGEFILIF